MDHSLTTNLNNRSLTARLLAEQGITFPWLFPVAWVGELSVTVKLDNRTLTTNLNNRARATKLNDRNITVGVN